MGLSGSSKTSNTNQTQTANSTTSQQQAASSIAAQLQQQNQNQNQSFSNTNGPSAFAQPYIQQALAAAQSGYNQQGANDMGAAISGLVPGLVERFNGTSSAYAAPRDYLTGVMNGTGGNPMLDRIIADTNASVADTVNARIGSRGGAGGSAQMGLLSRELGKNEAGLRYNDYTTQLGRQDAAARSLADLAGAESGATNNNLAAIISAATAGAGIPQSSANSFAQTLGQLLSGYTTQSGTSAGTQSGTSSGINAGNTSGTMSGTSNTVGNLTGTTTEKSSGGGFLDSLLGLGGMALGGWAGGGFR